MGESSPVSPKYILWSTSYTNGYYFDVCVECFPFVSVYVWLGESFPIPGFEFNLLENGRDDFDGL